MNPSLFSLTLPASRNAIPLVHALIREQMRALHFPESAFIRVELATEEACLNVIQHAYPQGSSGPLIVRARLEKAMLVLAIDDEGIPRDPFARLQFSPETPTAPGLGSRLMQAMSDGVRYESLGKQGKRVEILVRLPADEAGNEMPVEAGDTFQKVDGATLSVRLFQPADAGKISQCAWRCYGYSYLSEHLYQPERIIAMNASGEMLSAVAVDAEGRVYGHSALVFSEGSPVPESGQALVVPEARGGHTFRRMKALLTEEMRRRGVPGIWSEAVTLHPGSQKSNVELGISECGFIPGMSPPSLRMKAIGDTGERRQGLMLFYLPLENAPQSRVCLPSHHQGFLSGIYRAMGFSIELIPPRPLDSLVLTHLGVQLRADLGIAWLKCLALGGDLVTAVNRERVRLCEAGARVVVLDLPMDAPGLPGAVAAMECEEWGLCGIIPRLLGGVDALRMVYLDNVQIDPGIITTASDHGRHVVEYTLATIPPALIVPCV